MAGKCPTFLMIQGPNSPHCLFTLSFGSSTELGIQIRKARLLHALCEACTSLKGMHGFCVTTFRKAMSYQTALKWKRKECRFGVQAARPRRFLSAFICVFWRVISSELQILENLLCWQTWSWHSDWLPALSVFPSGYSDWLSIIVIMLLSIREQVEGWWWHWVVSAWPFPPGLDFALHGLPRSSGFAFQVSQEPRPVPFLSRLSFLQRIKTQAIQVCRLSCHLTSQVLSCLWPRGHSWIPVQGSTSGMGILNIRANSRDLSGPATSSRPELSNSCVLSLPVWRDWPSLCEHSIDPVILGL